MVSVIIPTYKRAEFLTRAIDSVLNQTYRDIEVIIVDDNDSDSIDREKIEKIMEQYKKDERVKYIKHTKNKNGAAARNTGLKVCKGEYITFLDDDDFFLKNRIQSMVELLDSETDYNAAYSNVVFVEKNKIIDSYASCKEGNLLYEMLIQDSFFKTGSNMFFRASAIKELNGFDERFQRHQDIEFMLRFFRKNKIKHLSNYSVVKDESSRINIPNPEKAIKMRTLFLDTFAEDIKSFENSEEIYLKNYQSLLNMISSDEEKSQEIIEIANKYGKITKRKNILKQIKNSMPIAKRCYKIVRGAIKSNSLKKEEKNEIKNMLNLSRKKGE